MTGMTRTSAPSASSGAVSDANAAAATDWRQILRLYDQLTDAAPGPVVALNRAVALAEVEGPGPALLLVDALGLDSYSLFHAVRADLLVRLGRRAEAANASSSSGSPARSLPSKPHSSAA